MIRTQQHDRIGFTTQPAHAALSGWMAAHWGLVGGGEGSFAQPGAWAAGEQAEAIRAETIFAIAEHDNGWWETDAAPQPCPRDGLPPNFTEQVEGGSEVSLNRWRRGVARFADQHPYVALLISLHAYHLVAAELRDDLDARLQYPGLGKADLAPADEPPDTSPPAPALERFVREQEETQTALTARVGRDARLRSAIDPEQLRSAVRLLQICDWLSLAICLGQGDGWQANDVPRSHTDDHVTLTLRSPAPRVLMVDPYPFEHDPLIGAVPMRWLAAPETYDPEGIARWHATPLAWMRVELRSMR